MNNAPTKILVLGGAKSGKSAFAENLCESLSGQKIYLATGQAGDGEMSARIKTHQARRDTSWQTIEAPLDLAPALKAHDKPDTIILLDCLTLWISNLMMAEQDFDSALTELLSQIKSTQANLVIVSNEVGQGIVPDNKLARRFRDQAGIAHQNIANLCAEVFFVTAGLPQKLKG